MSLTPGTQLGPYEILDPIGAGGMGEVYRARDTKLGREVAIKVLPEAFAQNEERLARFEREARLLASLNHPNIATLYGLEQSDGVQFLVMELADGETLAERLRRGPIPVEDTLPIFKQIAEALEAAHEKGIIHRDLKPANINVSSEGKVKVLDFGLAKAMSGDPVKSEASESPTITRDATATGVILGTAAYMSPEQARGKPVDMRTDIWAFGCVFFETLTGRTGFLGETVSDTISAILRGEPNWQALPESTPAIVRSLLRHCLQKDPNRRLHDIADARIEIEDVLTRSSDETEPHRLPSPPVWQRTLPWGVSAVAVMAAVGAWIGGPTSAIDDTSAVPARFSIELPADQHVAMDMDELLMAISQDGRRLAWIGVVEPERRIYTPRSIDELEVLPIAGTEGVSNLFLCLSSDGRWVAFPRDGALWKVPVEGGVAMKLLQSETATGIWSCEWGDDKIIVGLAMSGLRRISASGGEPEILTTLDRERGEIVHWAARILPKYRATLFAVQVGNFNDSHIEVLDLHTGERRVVIEDAASAQFVSSGHLVFARDGTVFAVPFDPERLEATGPEVPVLSDVQMDIASGQVGQLVVSRNGTLVYVPGRQGFGEQRLAFVDRQGKTELIATAPGAYSQPSFSPEGTELAVVQRIGHVEQLALYDLIRNVQSQFTFEGSSNRAPVWSPEGSSIAFSSNREGQWNLFAKPVDGDASAVRLQESDNLQRPSSWSPDGGLLIYGDRSPSDQLDVRLLPVDETSPQLVPFLTAETNEIPSGSTRIRVG